MAYLGFDEFGALSPAHQQAPGRPHIAIADADDTAGGEEVAARLSPLEWAVVVVARHDQPSSLREPGRLAMALGNLFGKRPNPRLADPRLEALRRLAVLTWHDRVATHGHEMAAFLAAGFTAAQYRIMRASIRAATVNKAQRA
ncbi:MAG: hypothetical protein DI544_09940 [Sphingomonas taxi]|uniref:Uncharacterized protein n=1 Tax=Sphingomonas taxi TaxID=1549858 RepID=A0A2W5P6V0_9SPHN|nr:MAG: hypothetical protein DI544_09940 [Sphingomonas taxi]